MNSKTLKARKKKLENIQSSQDKQQTLVQYKSKHPMFTLNVKRVK